MPQSRLAPHLLLCYGFIAVILLALLALRGDAGLRVAELCRSVPYLGIATARHLVLDDNRQFRRYIKSMGPFVYPGVFQRISEMIWSAPPDSYQVVFDRLSPYLERMGKGIAEVYDDHAYLRDLERRSSLGAKWPIICSVMQTAPPITACDPIGAATPLIPGMRSPTARARPCRRVWSMIFPTSSAVTGSPS